LFALLLEVNVPLQPALNFHPKVPNNFKIISDQSDVAVWLTRRVSRIDRRNRSRRHFLRRAAQSRSTGSLLQRVLVHGEVIIIFVVSVCLSVCLCRVSQPSLIRFRS